LVEVKIKLVSPVDEEVEEVVDKVVDGLLDVVGVFDVVGSPPTH